MTKQSSNPVRSTLLTVVLGLVAAAVIAVVRIRTRPRPFAGQGGAMTDHY